MVPYRADECVGARDKDEADRGGFFKTRRPTPNGEPAIELIPFTRTVTASDRRAFEKRVAKRRRRKQLAKR